MRRCIVDLSLLGAAGQVRGTISQAQLQKEPPLYLEVTMVFISGYLRAWCFEAVLGSTSHALRRRWWHLERLG